MIKRILLFLFVVILSVLIGALYGVIHNQITYSISPEFFTKFLFFRFELDNYFDDSPRLGASIVGVFSTWWVGLVAGIILGLVAFVYDEPKTMLFQTLKAMAITIFVAVITPLFPVAISYYHNFVSQVDYNQYEISLPNNLSIENPIYFHLAGLIHDYSYIGGLLGLFVGITFLIWKYKRIVKPATG